MKKILSMLLLISTLFCIFSIPVLAAPEANTTETIETIETETHDEHSTSNKNVETVGWAHITIDTETNRPSNFLDHNFYVNIVNEETGKWNIVNVYYDNEYKARAELPYGKYYIAEAGVKNDMKGEFALSTGKTFELNEETHAVSVELGFSPVGIAEKPEPNEEINIEKEMGSLTISLNTNAYPIEEDVTVNIVEVIDATEFSNVLNKENNYSVTIDVPYGLYVINTDKSFVSNKEDLLVQIETEILVESEETTASIKLVEKTETEEPVKPAEPEDPSISFKTSLEETIALYEKVKAGITENTTEETKLLIEDCGTKLTEIKAAFEANPESYSEHETTLNECKETLTKLSEDLGVSETPKKNNMRTSTLIISFIVMMIINIVGITKIIKCLNPNYRNSK